jgi:hypothetical protein
VTVSLEATILRLLHDYGVVRVKDVGIKITIKPVDGRLFLGRMSKVAEVWLYTVERSSVTLKSFRLLGLNPIMVNESVDRQTCRF